MKRLSQKYISLRIDLDQSQYLINDGHSYIRDYALYNMYNYLLTWALEYTYKLLLSCHFKELVIINVQYIYLCNVTSVLIFSIYRAYLCCSYLWRSGGQQIYRLCFLPLQSLCPDGPWKLKHIYYLYKVVEELCRYKIYKWIKFE
jgi:hypothetical protein